MGSVRSNEVYLGPNGDPSMSKVVSLDYPQIPLSNFLKSLLIPPNYPTLLTPHFLDPFNPNKSSWTIPHFHRFPESLWVNDHSPRIPPKYINMYIHLPSDPFIPIKSSWRLLHSHKFPKPFDFYDSHGLYTALSNCRSLYSILFWFIRWRNLAFLITEPLIDA